MDVADGENSTGDDNDNLLREPETVVGQNQNCGLNDEEDETASLRAAIQYAVLQTLQQADAADDSATSHVTPPSTIHTIAELTFLYATQSLGPDLVQFAAHANHKRNKITEADVYLVARKTPSHVRERLHQVSNNNNNHLAKLATKNQQQPSTNKSRQRQRRQSSKNNNDNDDNGPEIDLPVKKKHKQIKNKPPPPPENLSPDISSSDEELRAFLEHGTVSFAASSNNNRNNSNNKNKTLKKNKKAFDPKPKSSKKNISSSSSSSSSSLSSNNRNGDHDDSDDDDHHHHDDKNGNKKQTTVRKPVRSKPIKPQIRRFRLSGVASSPPPPLLANAKTNDESLSSGDNEPEIQTSRRIQDLLDTQSSPT